MLRSVLACASMAFASIAAGQVLECTNAAGAKQYAQICPADTVQQREVVKAGDTGANPASPAPKSIEVQDAEYKLRLKERQEKEAQAEQDKTRADEAERNCAEARKELEIVQDGPRMQRFDPATGERIYYTEDDRTQAIERQRKAISNWCK
jgi:hypothetical protein